MSFSIWHLGPAFGPISISIELGPWAIRWASGFMDSHPAAKGHQEAGFTQPGADLLSYISAGAELAMYLRGDVGLVLRVGDPVVVLEGVHRLQDGGDAPHVRVDLRVRKELRGQVRVELHLQCICQGQGCHEPIQGCQDTIE